MRWLNLAVGSEEERRLPGYRDPAVVRTFKAPEALDTRFYEVYARSALNRVPEASRMPFRWTVNPYRGCSHACAYCLSADTPILMGDGRWRPIADIGAGDRVYGTVRRGRYRRYSITTVLDHWSTTKPGLRIVLEDGTELVASGDHRFLSNRGWKYVTGAEQGPNCRPHLTTNNKLLGVGRFASQPTASADYRRGYLCGMIRGDGHVGSYTYDRPGRGASDFHRFRLALADLEPLRRTREYLSEIDVATQEFGFSAATANHRAVTAIRTSTRANAESVRSEIQWPTTPTDDWRKGFLAGIFDAEGGRNECVRISNTDAEIIGRIGECLSALGFPYVVEDRGLENGLEVVRLLGGLPQQMRFFHTVDPATSRKRSIEGTALKSQARLNVVAIEPMGIDLPMFDITTGTGDFIANGVVSHNCFARPTHEFLGMNAGRDFEKEIVVKVNVPEVLRAELRKPSWKREHVALGTNTDPYQWVEGRYRLMRGIWEALRDYSNPCSILTKSPLLLRDLDLMKEIAERTEFSACLSIPTLDEKAWRQTEPHTPNPRARLEAVAELNRAGIPTGVLIAPLMPGVNDSPEQVGDLVDLCHQAGAVSIGGVALHLRGSVRGVFFDWLRANRPDLIDRYTELYARGAYAPKAERSRLQNLVKTTWPTDYTPLSEAHREAMRRGRTRFGVSGANRSRRAEAPDSEQATLF